MRLKGYDYRSPGAYFVTICVYQMRHLFGCVKDGEMRRSSIGKIAHDNWLRIPDHHPNVVLDAFIVMPNHMHGIVWLVGGDDDFLGSHRDTIHRVRPPEFIGHKKSTAMPGPKEGFGNPVKGSLSTIIRTYKASVTRDSRRQGITFRWQSRFHERIIRNSRALHRIRIYIERNPLKWSQKWQQK